MTSDDLPVIERLRDLVEFARASTPHYAATLADRPIERVEDFEALPVLTAELLRAGTPPRGRALFSRPPAGAYVFSTGGTTGAPKYTFRDHEDFADNHRYLAGLDVQPGDVAANLFTPGIWGTYTSHNKALEQVGCVIVPIGSSGLSEELADASVRAMRELSVNVLLGTPSILVGLAKLLRRRGVRLDVAKVYLVGEMVYPSTHAFLRQELGDPLIRSMYGTVDCAGIGVQCRHLGPTEYHALPYVHVEIVDGDGRPAGREPGEVLVTVLKRRLVPMIRYRVGDRARWVDRACPCGARGPTLEVLGRADSVMNVASAHVPLQAVADAVAGLPALSDVFQVRLDRRDTRDRMTIHAETRAEVGEVDRAELAARLRRAVLTAEPELASVVSAGKCDDLGVVLVGAGGLPRTAGAGKVAPLLDERA